MSAELAEFVLARVAEVEQMAEVGREFQGERWSSDEECCVTDSYGDTFTSPVECAPHIAYWDPARVLAKCKADRLIVAEHSAWPGDDPDCVGCGLTMYEEPRTPDVNQCPVLRALASQWDDHPDWRAEWVVS